MTLSIPNRCAAFLIPYDHDKAIYKQRNIIQNKSSRLKDSSGALRDVHVRQEHRGEFQIG